MWLFEFEKKDTGRSYRRRALQEYSSSCDWCGYSFETKMLEVDHIDGNRKNNLLENLQVLCCWCHKIKTMKLKWHAWDGQDISNSTYLRNKFDKV